MIKYVYGKEYRGNKRKMLLFVYLKVALIWNNKAGIKGFFPPSKLLFIKSENQSGKRR